MDEARCGRLLGVASRKRIWSRNFGAKEIWSVENLERGKSGAKITGENGRLGAGEVRGALDSLLSAHDCLFLLLACLSPGALEADENTSHQSEV